MVKSCCLKVVHVNIFLNLDPPSLDTPAGPNEFVKVTAGKVVVGKPADFPSYGWDNEYGQAEME